MKPRPIQIANRILDALANDYAGMPECSDRRAKEWKKLFKKADELDLLDDALLKAMMDARIAALDDTNLRLVRAGDPAPAPRACSFSLREDAAVLTIGNLDSLEASLVLANNADAARRASKLVMDLRGCTGGVEQAAYPLLNWLFDQATTLEQLVGPQHVLTNYTEASCDARETQISQLKTLISAQGGSDTTAWLDQSLEACRTNRGKGYVRETAFPADIAVEAGPAGQRAFLLVDHDTEAAAEWLALTASPSSRVRIVGEATRGSLDYSNPVSLSFGDRFVFVYPMSKTMQAADGKGFRGRGVPPHVMCEASSALETALSL